MGSKAAWENGRCYLLPGFIGILVQLVYIIGKKASLDGD